MGFGFAVVAAVGVEDNSFDDTRTLSKFADAAVEVFAARTGAVEHHQGPQKSPAALESVLRIAAIPVAPGFLSGCSFLKFRRGWSIV
jgi:hypothetical protein